MAQRTQIILIDDVDGSDATDTVHFGLDGVTYEIDLSGPNAHALRASMGDWINSARRVGGRKNTRRARGSGARA